MLKAMNEVSENPDHSTGKGEEEKNASKNSTASAEQNVVLNLLKKSRSQSNTHSYNRSSDRQDSSLSDMRNNSMNEGRNHHRAKTEKSFSDNTANNDQNPTQYSPLVKLPGKTENHRKDSENTLKTANVKEERKFSEISKQIRRHQRSKSFTKP